MTKVAILPVPKGDGVLYTAVSGDKHSQGATAGQALDALSAQLSPQQNGAVVVIQRFRPDEFFGAAQIERLTQLMALWRDARDGGRVLPAEQQAELEALVEAELRASGARAAYSLAAVNSVLASGWNRMGFTTASFAVRRRPLRPGCPGPCQRGSLRIGDPVRFAMPVPCPRLPRHRASG